jgi:ABC-type lipoprotein export system ATPase subunit
VTALGEGIYCAGLLQLYPGEDAPVVALRNVDLEVQPGELVAILGPSGSGKSTLLSVLSGLLRPTAGAVRVAGHDLTRMGDAELSRLRATELALMLQAPGDNLLPYATALQNVGFAQRGARHRRESRRSQPIDALGDLGLSALAHRTVASLSGGQQQQVALAALLANSPKVVLADEPTAHLDPGGRDALIEAIRRTNQLSEATVVVVTHDPVVAAALPRTVTINHGQVGSEGRRGEQYAVLGRDGTIQLPAEVISEHPAGTLFAVQRTPEGIELRPERST